MRRYKKGALIGAFVGLLVFVILGFLPSAYTGGLVGIKLAELLFGVPIEPSIGPRILVGLLMIVSVIFSGALFVIGGAICGWLISTLLGKRKVSEDIT